MPDVSCARLARFLECLNGVRVLQTYSSDIKQARLGHLITPVTNHNRMFRDELDRFFISFSLKSVNDRSTTDTDQIEGRYD